MKNNVSYMKKEEKPMKNTLKEKTAKMVEKTAVYFAKSTVGKSYPISIYDVKVPQEVKKYLNK